jgi:hypothetical protein
MNERHDHVSKACGVKSTDYAHPSFYVVKTQAIFHHIERVLGPCTQHHFVNAQTLSDLPIYIVPVDKYCNSTQ